MTTLKEAKEQGKLKEFIKEHSKDPKGDKAKFDKLIKSISQKSKAPQASSQDKSEN
jgi:hypothetical protein